MYITSLLGKYQYIIGTGRHFMMVSESVWLYRKGNQLTHLLILVAMAMKALSDNCFIINPVVGVYEIQL